MNQPGNQAHPAELREHEFDGIQEFDNHLPNWWLWTFYGACIFAFFYWLYYHGYGFGKSPMDNYRAEAAAAQAAAVETMFTDDELRAASKDAAVVKAGSELFTANCVACHAPNAGGILNGALLPGPNLTDNAWIHGGAPMQIFATVWKGVPEKGMVTWGPVLGKERIRSVVAYVLTLRNTNVAGGKPPEGQVYEGN
ncbi:MAG: cbb3-type cytochrome c oxidase N-terminal domain-containing protein [Planctomycetota bacterium]